MCGIALTVNYPKSVVENILFHQRMRGPDSGNISHDSNVVLGHNLLSIIGHQEQPLHGERYSMVFNGCVYNFKDLEPYSTSDTQTVLNQFESKGLKAVNDFNGMFAIGLYDAIDKEIHLFVDRFGEKPIYYYHEGDKFAVASSPGALYQIKDKWEIDREALQSYWLLGSVMGEDGLMKGIKKLTASQHLTYNIRENRITIERYWEPKFQENTNGIEDLVIDAIQKVKVSDVPVHIFLSGGIDSTLVASQFEGGDAIHLDSPEFVYAEHVAERFQVKLKRVLPSDISVERDLKDFCLKSGEPCMSALIPYVTARETADYGRVAITANGADELFFGYDRTHDDVTINQINHIFRSPLGTNSNFIPWFDKATGRSLELQRYVQYDLNKTLDFASMCHCVEVRSPFLDHRLVEMALSITEKVHRKNGNKTILKNMLKKMGFSERFVNRAKLGFSMHAKPEGIDELTKRAWYWCQAEGFLKVDEKRLNARDLIYLKNSALSFYYWFDVWKGKL